MIMAFDMNAYQKEYQKAHYKKVYVRVPIEKIDVVKQAAKQAGMPVARAMYAAFCEKYGINH